MNVQPNLRMDKAAFIAGMQASAARCELVRGRVMMLPGGSLSHALIVSNLVGALRGRLDRRQWAVISEFGLDTRPDTLRYPDIIVDRAGGNSKSYTATAPVLIIEVLSPSTAATDLGDKAAEYLQIATLGAYIVVAQNEPKAWVWTRGSGLFTARPGVIAGTDAIIDVLVLGLALPLAEVYADIDLG
jgi:Uma2 family endonuclease